MISRITGLEIENFRCISGAHKVSLDSPVVLIHGPNGSGKSTLLQALEYALTGKVQDLQRYGDDYPRCLVNQFAHDDMSVKVRFRDENQREACSGAGVQHECAPQSIQIYFRERAFLSQQQLTRLLETYEGDPGPGGEQPLVRFIQDLLQLDDLVSLNEGLHPAMDRRWLRKECHKLVELEEEAQLLTAQASAARETSQIAVDSATASIESLITLIRDVRLANLPQVDASATLEELDSLRGLLSEMSLALAAAVERSAMHIERLGDARRVEEDAAEHGSDAAKAALATLDAARAEMRQSEGKLAALREVVEPSVLNLGAEFARLAEEHDSLAFLASCEERLAKLEEELQDQLERVVAGSGNLALWRDQLAAQVSQLEGLSDVSDDQLAYFEALSALLMEAQPLADSDLCPVCGRDYSELQLGALQDAIRSRVDELARECSLGVDRARERKQLTSAMARLNDLISTTQSELDALPSAGSLERRSKAVHDLRMLLESASDDRAGARNHLERMADAEAEVQRRTEIDARSRSARLSLLEIAEEVGVPVADQAVSFSSLSASC